MPKTIIRLDTCLQELELAKNDEWLNDVYNNQSLFGGFSYHSSDSGIRDIYIKAAYDCRNKGMSFPEMLDNLKGIRINISSPVTKEQLVNKYANMQGSGQTAIQQPAETKPKNSPVKSTLLFWLCVFFGPLAVSLISYFSYAVMGLAEGLIFDITFLIVALIAQAASCYVGYSIAFHYSPNSRIPMINGIICIIMLAIISYNSLLYASYIEVASYALGIITLIFCILQKDKMIDFRKF